MGEIVRTFGSVGLLAIPSSIVFFKYQLDCRFPIFSLSIGNDGVSKMTLLLKDLTVPNSIVDYLYFHWVSEMTEYRG